MAGVRRLPLDLRCNTTSQSSQSVCTGSFFKLTTEPYASHARPMILWISTVRAIKPATSNNPFASCPMFYTATANTLPKFSLFRYFIELSIPAPSSPTSLNKSPWYFQMMSVQNHAHAVQYSF